ncbi:hypothetical protein GCM10022384_51670 [Streptomyces marokkonensis]|uniref:Uncharacterized protein n=1 Tax=Streptomyces marokkonensis TaxID=324855 RepID=A0ABP7RJE5_9ACTN
MDRGIKSLLDEVNRYPDAGGYGTAPRVWAKSVVSIGGAAIGFTTTANNYANAEAANDPSGATKAVTQPLRRLGCASAHFTSTFTVCGSQ